LRATPPPHGRTGRGFELGPAPPALDRDDARREQVQAVEEPRDLGVAAVPPGLAGEAVVPPGRFGYLLGGQERLFPRGQSREHNEA